MTEAHRSTHPPSSPRKIGTNWFIPALVNSKFGESGIKLDDGTMVCCFDLKKSRKLWRISALVMRWDMESERGILGATPGTSRVRTWASTTRIAEARWRKDASLGSRV
jgi:hypothetical protein